MIVNLSREEKGELNACYQFIQCALCYRLSESLHGNKIKKYSTQSGMMLEHMHPITKLKTIRVLSFG